MKDIFSFSLILPSLSPYYSHWNHHSLQGCPCYLVLLTRSTSCYFTTKTTKITITTNTWLINNKNVTKCEIVDIKILCDGMLLSYSVNITYSSSLTTLFILFLFPLQIPLHYHLHYLFSSILFFLLPSLIDNLFNTFFILLHSFSRPYLIPFSLLVSSYLYSFFFIARFNLAVMQRSKIQRPLNIAPMSPHNEENTISLTTWKSYLERIVKWKI